MPSHDAGEMIDTEGHPPLIYLASLCATLVEENQQLVDQKFGTPAMSNPSAGPHARNTDTPIVGSTQSSDPSGLFKQLSVSGTEMASHLSVKPTIIIPRPVLAQPNKGLSTFHSLQVPPSPLEQQFEGADLLKETGFISASSKHSLFQRTLQRVRRNSFSSAPGSPLKSHGHRTNISMLSSAASSTNSAGPDSSYDQLNAMKTSRRRVSDPTTADNRLKARDGSSLVCFCCNDSFATEEELVIHSANHVNNAGANLKRNNQCPVCGKCFSKNAHLTSHLRIHTGEKPFKCDICGKKFTQKSTLNRHSRVHTGEKPFECSLCGKRFAQQSALTSHTRTHTGERPFQCDICHKRFNKSGHLYRHKRIVHARFGSAAYGSSSSSVKPDVVLRPNPVNFLGKSAPLGLLPPPLETMDTSPGKLVSPPNGDPELSPMSDDNAHQEYQSSAASQSPEMGIDFPGSNAP